ncbi:MAG: endonuclease domain-containing protein [Caulobacterales bacterium]|nr:endonuclease domain-containing protein [Caulobacterales bacterium]
MPYTAKGYRARALRNAMTEPEVILWSGLKQLRAEGFHFRRQTPFRGYFLDFVCFSRRVVIEVDGEVHESAVQAAHDGVRDAVLRREGFKVLRFWNGEVRQDLDGVMYSIRAALAEAPVSPPGSRRREPPSP